MALRINTNVTALNAHKNMIDTDNRLSNSLNRLSTGLRINKAADDASGMIIADSLKAQYMGIGQAIRNANDGISIVQTADGALQESINIINTIKTKAIQAASDGQTTKTRTAIQNDIDKLMEELDVIAKTTSFNGQKLLSGVFTNKSIQIGAFSRETASISIGSTESTKMGHVTTANLSLTGSGGEVQLSITSALTGEVLTLNEIDIQSNNNAENGMGALADEVNRYTSATGIKATAMISSTTSSAIAAGTTGSDFAINGITIGAITATANDSSGALLTAINGKTAEHGITASMEEDGALTLTSSDGRSIEVTGSISDVFGSTAAQMSTIGYLQLSQSGVTQFQINGIGAGAAGADINIDIGTSMTTVEDSFLAAGSVISSGSLMAAGSTLGGDALVESTVSGSQLDYELKTGSSIYWGSNIEQGTTLGGTITVGGDLGSTATNVTALAEDMLVTAGSKLVANSVIGAGTVVSTQFTSGGTGGTTYSVGDTLTSAITLGSDITLAADMTLKYDSDAGDNSAIEIGSTLAAGTIAGMDLNDVGQIYTTATVGTAFTSGASQLAAAQATAGEGTTATTSALYTHDSYTNTGYTLLLKAGSELASGTVLQLATGSTTYTGPTLVIDGGTLEMGDTISASAYTLNGTQIIGEDITTAVITSGTLTTSIASGSTLAAGFTATLTVTTNAAVTSGVNVNSEMTLTEATLSQDMTLKAGSTLQTGSKLIAGSVVGDATYIMGGALNSSGQTLTTYQRTELKAGSKLFSETGNVSVIGEGSTIGGNATLNGAETLTSDMTLTAGSIMKAGTVLEKGTIINQEIQFNEATDPIAAGTELSQDMTLTNDVTLTSSMTALKDTVLAADSVIGINTENAGTVGLSDTLSSKLSDLSVLTQEGAQLAIDIAESALEALDRTRAGLGSVQNQFTSTISNLSVTKTNIQASESAIRDVDFAEESMNFARLQLLSQTGSYALAQANASSQTIMSLLQ